MKPIVIIFDRVSTTLVKRAVWRMKPRGRVTADNARMALVGILLSAPFFPLRERNPGGAESYCEQSEQPTTDQVRTWILDSLASEEYFQLPEFDNFLQLYQP